MDVTTLTMEGKDSATTNSMLFHEGHILKIWNASLILIGSYLSFHALVVKMTLTQHHDKKNNNKVIKGNFVTV